MPQMLISYTDIPKENPLKHSVGVITSGYARQRIAEDNRQLTEPIRVNGFESLKTLITALDKGDFEQGIVSATTYFELDKKKKAALKIRRLTKYDQPLAIAASPLNRELVQSVGEAVTKIRSSKEYEKLVLDWFPDFEQNKKQAGDAE